MWFQLLNCLQYPSMQNPVSENKMLATQVTLQHRTGTLPSGRMLWHFPRDDHAWPFWTLYPLSLQTQYMYYYASLRRKKSFDHNIQNRNILQNKRPMAISLTWEKFYSINTFPVSWDVFPALYGTLAKKCLQIVTLYTGTYIPFSFDVYKIKCSHIIEITQ